MEMFLLFRFVQDILRHLLIFILLNIVLIHRLGIQGIIITWYIHTHLSKE
nr:MAG TPA_asm: hypothetical protein [Bacteriophage sp.]